MRDIFDTRLLSRNQYDNFDQMADIAASAWDQRYRKLEGSQESGFAHQLNLPAAQVTHIGWQPSMRIESGTPLRSVGFVMQTSEYGRMSANGQPVTADQILVMHSPRDYDLVNPSNTSYLVLAIEEQRVLDHIESLWGSVPGKFSETTHLQSSAHFQREHIAPVFHSTLNHAYRDPDCLAHQQELEATVEELLDTMLLGSQPVHPEHRHAKRHQLAKRAAEYLHDNVDSLVTLRSMCDYVGVSERSLRQGFIERYGLSPKAYIKHHRLYRLHQLLRDSAPGELTVTQAALKTGLTHLGRLANEYRNIFAESPRQTLLRLPR